MTERIIPVPEYPAAVTREALTAVHLMHRVVRGIPGHNDLTGGVLGPYLSPQNAGTNLYSHFPYLFADAVPCVPPRELRWLCVSSLFFLMHVVLTDAQLDEDERPRFTDVIFNNAFQSLAWRTLAKASTRKNLPWSALSSYYREYTNAVWSECQYCRGPRRAYSAADKTTIVARRCAVSKIVTRMLLELGDRNDLVGHVDESLDCFWLADCMRDDWRDWKADLKHGRMTYLLSRAIESGLGGQKYDLLAESARLEEIGKYIYGSGFLVDYLAEIAGHLEDARKSVSETGCSLWMRFLGSQISAVHSQRSHIIREMRSLQREHGRGQSRCDMSHPKNTLIAESSCVEADAATALRRAVKFASNCDVARGVTDFITPYGELDTWILAYLGCALHTARSSFVRWGEQGDILSERRIAELLAAIVTLSIERRRSNGWSANVSMPCDAETTAWVLRFLLMSPDPPVSVAEAWNMLMAFRRSDGGFSRFTAHAAGPAFPAWSVSHPEVSGLVLGTLPFLNTKVARSWNEDSWKYLRASRGPDGLWRSYWWEGQTYATFHCLSATQASGYSTEKQDYDEVLHELLGQQEFNGSWGDTLRGRSTVFETAWAVRLLLRFRQESAVEARKRAIRWLISEQLPDGSWLSEPVLRFPFGSDFAPWKFNNWSLDSSAGYGSLIRDHRRLATTASAISAIADFVNAQTTD